MRTFRPLLAGYQPYLQVEVEEEDPDAEADELARDTEEQARYLVITHLARTRYRGAGRASLLVLRVLRSVL